MKPATAAIVMVALGACAPTRPGKYREPDFVWEDVMVPTSYVKAYRRVFEGFRQCGPSTAAVFATPIGVPECFDDHEHKVVLCDVYFESPRGGRSNRVLGQIELVATSDHETRARLGVLRDVDEPWFGRQGATRKIWLSFVRGEDSCVR